MLNKVWIWDEALGEIRLEWADIVFARYIEAHPVQDREPCRFLRPIRDKLGYGHCWTLGGALWEEVSPWMGFIVLFLALAARLWWRAR